MFGEIMDGKEKLALEEYLKTFVQANAVVEHNLTTTGLQHRNAFSSGDAVLLATRQAAVLNRSLAAAYQLVDEGGVENLPSAQPINYDKNNLEAATNDAKQKIVTDLRDLLLALIAKTPPPSPNHGNTISSQSLLPKHDMINSLNLLLNKLQVSSQQQTFNSPNSSPVAAPRPIIANPVSVHSGPVQSRPALIIPQHSDAVADRGVSSDSGGANQALFSQQPASRAVVPHSDKTTSVGRAYFTSTSSGCPSVSVSTYSGSQKHERFDVNNNSNIQGHSFSQSPSKRPSTASGQHVSSAVVSSPWRRLSLEAAKSQTPGKDRWDNSPNNTPTKINSSNKSDGSASVASNRSSCSSQDFKQFGSAQRQSGSSSGNKCVDARHLPRVCAPVILPMRSFSVPTPPPPTPLFQRTAVNGTLCRLPLQQFVPAAARPIPINAVQLYSLKMNRRGENEYWQYRNQAWRGAQTRNRRPSRYQSQQHQLTRQQNRPSNRMPKFNPGWPRQNGSAYRNSGRTQLRGNSSGMRQQSRDTQEGQPRPFQNELQRQLEQELRRKREKAKQEALHRNHVSSMQKLQNRPSYATVAAMRNGSSEAKASDLVKRIFNPEMASAYGFLEQKQNSFISGNSERTRFQADQRREEQNAPPTSTMTRSVSNSNGLVASLYAMSSRMGEEVAYESAPEFHLDDDFYEQHDDYDANSCAGHFYCGDATPGFYYNAGAGEEYGQTTTADMNGSFCSMAPSYAFVPVGPHHSRLSCVPIQMQPTAVPVVPVYLTNVAPIPMIELPLHQQHYQRQQQQMANASRGANVFHHRPAFDPSFREAAHYDGYYAGEARAGGAHRGAGQRPQQRYVGGSAATSFRGRPQHGRGQHFYQRQHSATMHPPSYAAAAGEDSSCDASVSNCGTIATEDQLISDLESLSLDRSCSSKNLGSKISSYATLADCLASPTLSDFYQEPFELEQQQFDAAAAGEFPAEDCEHGDQTVQDDVDRVPSDVTVKFTLGDGSGDEAENAAEDCKVSAERTEGLANANAPQCAEIGESNAVNQDGETTKTTEERHSSSNAATCVCGAGAAKPKAGLFKSSSAAELMTTKRKTQRIGNQTDDNDCAASLDGGYISESSSVVGIHSVFRFQSPPPMDEFLSHSPWNDNVSRQIWHNYIRHRQDDALFQQKTKLKESMQKALQDVYPTWMLYIVGSSQTGFGSRQSDVDICLMLRKSEIDQRIEAVNILQQACNVFESKDMVAESQLINAKVPILRVRFKEFPEVCVDLNANNPVSVKNTHLLYYYASIDWRVRPLVLAVKEWAQCWDINDASRCTLSSYSLVLMVIHYLQAGVEPPVLPCLQRMYPIKFDPSTDVSLLNTSELLDPPADILFAFTNHLHMGQLMLGFLEYFAYGFDFDNWAISVRCGSKCSRAAVVHNNSPFNDFFQWKCICIEEPFNLSNTARAVYDDRSYEHVRNVFIRSHQILRDAGDLCELLRAGFKREP